MMSESITERIEWQLSLLSRLWVAEYLHAGAFDKRMNRELFDKLTGPKPLSSGQWVALARRIRQKFSEHRLATVVEDLQVQDFGEFDDRTHPVARLLDFRNTFSHGGLNATEDEIRTHQALLDEIIAQVPSLRERPILFRTENGLTLVADTGQPVPTTVNSIAEPPLQPFIVSRDGRTVLHLYPLLHVASDSNGYKLMPADPKKRTHPITTLFERETVRAWVEQYQLEKKGHLDFDARVRERVSHPIPKAILDEAGKALLTDGVSLVVVEAHPGCGKAGVLTHLCDSSLSCRYAAVCFWLVEPDDLGQSGIVFVNFLLRQTEKCLGLRNEALGLATTDWQEMLNKAKQILAQEGKRLLIGIEDLHTGYEPLGNETVSVTDVYRTLVGGPITVVATVHTGRSPGRLVFDRIVRLSVPPEGDIDIKRLELTVLELCPPGQPMRIRVLRELTRSTASITLLALCDALEVSGGTVFEPAVERALWDLRPLLLVTGTGDAKSWSLFTPALMRVPLIGGGQ